MQYPKPIMSVSELIPLGFSKDYLRQMAHVKGQTYATQRVRNGKFLFDTEKFERYRQKTNVR